MRVYRGEMASRDSHRGRPLSAETLQDSHASIRMFLRWADTEGYKVDARLLKLPRVKVPAKEPTVYHLSQLRQMQSLDLRLLIVSIEVQVHAISAELELGCSVNGQVRADPGGILQDREDSVG